MLTQLYWVEGAWPGRLAIAARPRGGDWLEDEMNAWHSGGISKVVSALTPDEIDELELQTEESACVNAGIRYVSFPIPDRGVPNLGATCLTLQSLESDLKKGQSTVIHCRQGIGRSSLLAASLLVLGGELSASAWRKVELARGRPVPDTPEQKAWVEGLSVYSLGQTVHAQSDAQLTNRM